MPSHSIHEKNNIAALIILIVFIAPRVEMWLTVYFTLAYLLATFYITPDLDVNSRIYRRWGILRGVWWPYRELMKHRGYSHHVVLGPALLIAYMLFIPVVIIILSDTLSINCGNTVAVVVGMWMAIEMHIITDYLL